MRNMKRDDESLGKRLKTTTTVPENKTAKKTTGVPKLRKRRGENPELGKSLVARG